MITNDQTKTLKMERMVYQLNSYARSFSAQQTDKQALEIKHGIQKDHKLMVIKSSPTRNKQTRAMVCDK